MLCIIWKTLDVEFFSTYSNSIQTPFRLMIFRLEETQFNVLKSLPNKNTLTVRNKINRFRYGTQTLILKYEPLHCPE